MPAGNLMTDWEDILNAYLEGRGLRADAEDLLLRLHLTAHDRDAIERALRLADDVATAVRQPQPPAGADARLLERLRACPAPDSLPQAWQPAGEDFEAASSSTALAEDDLFDAALEGRVSLNELRAMRDANDLTDSAREALDELESVDEAVTMGGTITIPTGMEDRLRTSLRSHMASDEGELDARVAERLLGIKRPLGRIIAPPDVLAAEEDPEGPSQ